MNIPKKKGRMVRLSDLQTTEKGADAFEKTYRKGYHQGFFAAVDAMEDGALPGQLWKLCERIRAWRSEQHDGQFVQPPQIEEVK